MSTKTLSDWNESKLRWDEFAKPGDEIDEDCFNYFMKITPPRLVTKKGYLMGELVDFNDDGNGLYEAFTPTHYLGLMTFDQFDQL